MANGMTVDQLYEAFMDMDTDDPTPFAEDVFGFFGKEELGGYTQKEWAKQYGTYLPTWDPAQINLAGRERDLDFTTAMDTLKTTQAATERVYATEMDTLSTTLGKELGKGREIAGGIGLRSGGLESALQDTIATTGSKAKDFGDRIRITGQETKDKYNTAMVDAALDFEKTERQEKEEFYDRTMAAIMRLMDTGAFDEPVDLPVSDADGVDPFDLQTELTLDWLDCTPPCPVGSTCIDGICVDSATLTWEDPGSTNDIMCGQYADYIEGQGCVPTDPEFQGDTITPSTCPTGTVWSDDAGGCIYVDPDGGIGCSGPCAVFLATVAQGYEAAKIFYTAEWNLLTNPEVIVDPIIADPPSGGDCTFWECVAESFCNGCMGCSNC